MRRRAREAALRALYRREYLALPEDELMEEAGEAGADEQRTTATLLAGILRHQATLDELIDARAHGWGVDRLALLDLNILRLALFELLYTQTPAEVVMDEAIELAKAYGTEKAPAFINAILDRVWKDKRSANTC